MSFKPARKCIETVYALLARREHSRQEMVFKLRQREWCDETEIDDLLDRFESENLLSDERYAEMAVRSGLQRGYGRIKIRNKLRTSGVSTSLITTYLDKANIDWWKLIHEVRLKKCGEHLPKDFAERAKLNRFLASRGFDTELIRQELDLISNKY